MNNLKLVQAVVDAGLRLGQCLHALDAVAGRKIAPLEGEVDDGGGAAERRRLRARLVSVRGRRGAEGVFHVGVAVDAAGQHQQSRRIHHGGRLALAEASADGGDAAVLDEDVGRVVVHGRDDAAVPDQCRGH
jgi:hypothetical protein